MVGGGNCDGVDVFLFENRAEVLVRRGGFACLALHSVRKFLEDIAVHVADVRDAGGASIGLECREMSVASAVQADDRKAQAIIGTEDPTITLCCRSHGQPGSAYG